jgi:hypothetical protein
VPGPEYIFCHQNSESIKYQQFAQTRMKRVTILLVLAVLAVTALAAGCTGTSPDTTPAPTTQSQTTTAPASTTAAPISLVPEPTDAMPADYTVSATAQKDPIYKTITVTFNGGKGQENVRQLTATVTRSDGTTETKILTKPSGASLSRGQTLEFTGTAAQDRIQVRVTMDRPLGPNSATEFKIYDVVLPPK